MTKRLGASGGVAARQLATKSVRNSSKSIKASMPTARLATCSRTKPGRAATCRVANTHQPGATPSRTSARRARKTKPVTHQHSHATASTPPMAKAPMVRSEAVSSNSTTSASSPSPATPSGRAWALPKSRRITRSGGTRTNCNSEGRPKHSNKVAPKARPRPTVPQPGAGKLVLTHAPSSHTNASCSANPSARPSVAANSATPANCQAKARTMVRCDTPSTRNKAHVSRRLCA